MRAFFDTSALLKRYVEETGSVKVQELCEQADELMVSIICLPETLSSLNRLRREGKLSDEQYRQLKVELEQDIDDATVCNLNTEVLAQAGCLS
jgi:predicted nucleic acid-binding protein